mmetsp:Transcript_53583/g.138525  ORF Transcript_53583/g.138525 Transcript_53583/m.138525 type:complete len:240 (+) Transcript_53583:98-817(+)
MHKHRLQTHALSASNRSPDAASTRDLARHHSESHALTTLETPAQRCSRTSHPTSSKTRCAHCISSLTAIVHRKPPHVISLVTSTHVNSHEAHNYCAAPAAAGIFAPSWSSVASVSSIEPGCTMFDTEMSGQRGLAPTPLSSIASSSACGEPICGVMRPRPLRVALPRPCATGPSSAPASSSWVPTSTAARYCGSGCGMCASRMRATAVMGTARTMPVAPQSAPQKSRLSRTVTGWSLSV